MVSQDFAIALITIIKKHAWAVDIFPEFQDKVTELSLGERLPFAAQTHCSRHVQYVVNTILPQTMNALME